MLRGKDVFGRYPFPKFVLKQQRNNPQSVQRGRFFCFFFLYYTRGGFSSVLFDLFNRVLFKKRRRPIFYKKNKRPSIPNHHWISHQKASRMELSSNLLNLRDIIRIPGQNEFVVWQADSRFLFSHATQACWAGAPPAFRLGNKEAAVLQS